MTDAVLTTRVPAALREQLEDEAAARGLKLSSLVNRILDDHANRRTLQAVSNDLGRVIDHITSRDMDIDAKLARIERLLLVAVGAPDIPNTPSEPVRAAARPTAPRAA